MPTPLSNEPTVAKNAVDLVSRINPKYHFPGTMKALERELRISLGLPFKGRIGGIIPYGYDWVAEKDSYIPNRDLFKLLWEARRYLYTSSLREVADWMNFKAEKYGHKQRISHQGLKNIMILRPPYEECMLSEAEKEKILESICHWNQQKTQM